MLRSLLRVNRNHCRFSRASLLLPFESKLWDHHHHQATPSRQERNAYSVSNGKWSPVAALAAVDVYPAKNEQQPPEESTTCTENNEETGPPKLREFNIDGNLVQVLNDGVEIFPEIEKAIQNAEKEILLEMYWFGSDKAGVGIAELLIQARQRGVEVIVVYDSFGSFESNRSLFENMRKHGCEVLEYNPLPPWLPGSWMHKMQVDRIWRRDHRKVMVVDRWLCITGGLNIGNYWLPKDRGGDAWRDVNIKLRGPSADLFANVILRMLPRLRDLHDDRGAYPRSISPAPREKPKLKASAIEQEICEQHLEESDSFHISQDMAYDTDGDSDDEADDHRFAQDYLFKPDQERFIKYQDVFNKFVRNQSIKQKKDEIQTQSRQALKRLRSKANDLLTKVMRSTSFGEDSLVVVTNDAWNERASIRHIYLRKINAAQHNVLIVNSYFIPDRRFRTALYRARKRGVRVQIMVPGELCDIPPVRYSTHALYDRLLRRGIEIYEWQPTVLHSKLIVVDDEVAAIGTFNLDYRSWLYNLEITVVMLDEAFAENLADYMRYDLATHCKQVELGEWRERSYFARVREQFFKLFRRAL